jgi:diacylglycerol kinase family enzyme
VAGGGDGTVNAVAGNLVGTGIALGVLPMGTLKMSAFRCTSKLPFAIFSLVN